MSDVVLDLIGLRCPLPALRTGRALDGLASGDVLCVMTSDPLASLDIPNLLRERGDALLHVAVAQGIATFRIQRG